MMIGESPRMLFEVIMNRFENDYSPDIIYDASCKLKEYAFNREPKRFMSTRVTSDRFHENNHKTCLVLKLHHILPSATLIPKHVSNLIVSCAESQARPPSCSSPYSWGPLLCSSLTKISLPTKKINNNFKMSILCSFIYLLSWFRLPHTWDTSVRNVCPDINIWCPL